MKILVICGAGASSSFVAARMRRTAAARGLDVEVVPSSEELLDTVIAGSDVLLLGSHLASHATGLQNRLGARPLVAVLPEAVFAAQSGDAALDIALSMTAAASEASS